MYSRRVAAVWDIKTGHKDAQIDIPLVIDLCRPAMKVFDVSPQILWSPCAVGARGPLTFAVGKNVRREFTVTIALKFFRLPVCVYAR